MAINNTFHTADADTLSDVETDPQNSVGSDLIVVSTAVYDFEATNTPEDSEGITWDALTERSGATDVDGNLFYKLSPATSGTHTFGWGGTGSFPAPAIGVAGFSGVNAYHSENGSSGDGTTSRSTGSVTPPEDGCLLIAWLVWNSVSLEPSLAIDNGFTILDIADWVNSTNCGIAMAYKVQGTAAAINPAWSWTPSANTAAGIAVFTPAASPPVAPSNYYHQMMGG